MIKINNNNIIYNVDSYKHSHYKQYPENLQYVSSYIEARSDKNYNFSLFFGLQTILEDLTAPDIMDVKETDNLLKEHGFDFNYNGWKDIVKLGYLPISIKAVPEGSLIPNHNVLMQIVNTDPRFPWLTSFVETALLRVWYPITVSTRSKFIKNIILDALNKSGDPSLIDFKLHDFGFRGVSSQESGSIGGLAHLVNFMGTDTIGSLRLAKTNYNCPMAGFSIPAAEHSTITSWGRDGEIQAYKNMLNQFAKPGKILAVVSDSYDLMYTVREIWGKVLKQDVIDSGATLVVRPDGGDPTTIPLDIIKQLAEDFGYTVNEKGYKVLVPCVRVIQGDGVNEHSIKRCLDNIMEAGFSADNITFGMGGELLQTVNRDTLGFAMKASAVMENGVWKDVYKEPKTDMSKASKKGVLALIKENGIYKTIVEKDLVNKDDNILKEVFRDGKILVRQKLDEIRIRSNTKV